MSWMRCPDCSGYGDDGGHACARCFGSGQLEVFRPHRRPPKDEVEVEQPELFSD